MNGYNNSNSPLGTPSAIEATNLRPRGEKAHKDWPSRRHSLNASLNLSCATSLAHDKSILWMVVPRLSWVVWDLSYFLYVKLFCKNYFDKYFWKQYTTITKLSHFYFSEWYFLTKFKKCLEIKKIAWGDIDIRSVVSLPDEITVSRCWCEPHSIVSMNFYLFVF